MQQKITFSSTEQKESVVKSYQDLVKKYEQTLDAFILQKRTTEELDYIKIHLREYKKLLKVVQDTPIVIHI
jgi:hypothetical protein